MLRRRFLLWASANRKLVIGACVGAVVFAVAEFFWLRLFVDSAPVFWYLLGLTHMMLIAAVGFALASGFVANDPQALSQLRGAWGEEATQDVLKKAKRKRLVWGCVDSIELAFGDIDHLVVTRHGGLVAIDSKWRNTFNPTDRDKMAVTAKRARLRAQGVVQSVFARERAGRRSTGSSVRVRPVVVVWGALQHEIPDNASVDGVDFVPGLQLLNWLKRLNGDPVDAAAARELLHRIESFRESARTS